ncbi:FG-GAP repeat domain-containing protein [Peribacillus sp. NPDC060186]
MYYRLSSPSSLRQYYYPYTYSPYYDYLVSPYPYFENRGFHEGSRVLRNVPIILWHNSSTNETQIWFMYRNRVNNRATVLGEDGSPAYVGGTWSIVGTGDMNGDGMSDIVWHNSSTNETQIWFMKFDRVVGRGTVLGEDGSPAYVGGTWSIVGIGDVNKNGYADIVWHNSSTNETQIWFMNGHRVVGRATVLGENGSPAYVGGTWSIVGVGDTSGDGYADIVWHNSSTNETQIWYMDGHRVVGRGTVLGEDGSPVYVGGTWSIVGVSDMNDDGKSDIVWHNSSTNETQIWFMNGHRVVSRGTVLGENGSPAYVGGTWSIVGASTGYFEPPPG